MKELTIEQKAAAYDEALKVANKYKDTHIMFPSIKDEMFPALKEGEDERIRKKLIAFVKSRLTGFPECDRFINWLEKQGEQKFADITGKLKEGYRKGWDDAMQQLPKEVDSQIWQIANNAAKTWEESFSILYATQKAYDKGKKDALKEQKPAWSEEDEDYYDAIIAKLEVTQDDAALTDNQMEFLKSLKDKVQPKVEWSEEDEAGLSDALWAIEQARTVAKDENDMGNFWYAENWLKSLKHKKQWKPSDEQMNALSIAVKHGQTDDPDALKKLLEQLKKLREE